VFESRRGLGIFLLNTASRTVLGPSQPPIQWLPGALSLGLKQPGREADHSPPSSAEVKNAWSYSSTPQYDFMAWCLVKHRGNFTLLYRLHGDLNRGTKSAKGWDIKKLFYIFSPWRRKWPLYALNFCHVVKQRWTHCSMHYKTHSSKTRDAENWRWNRTCVCVCVRYRPYMLQILIYFTMVTADIGPNDTVAVTDS
jgi:hypothetical protein